jgi:putative DNA primase/helicase
MDFQQFAEMHGLIIDHLVHDQLVYVPTTDKPRKQNGRYLWDGKSGWVMNWAIHDKPVSFRSKEFVPDPNYKAKRDKQIKERLSNQEKAQEKAMGVLKCSTILRHPYLVKKGFSTGNVWKELLVIPMMVDKKIVGCQLIAPDGTKRFLRGQITKGASFTIGSGRDIIVEGYATGLSVNRAILELGIKAKVHVCFSAGNMIEIAQKCKNPVVVADNDPVGIRTAKKIGKYWVSDVEGNDFNDDELRLGIKAVCQSLASVLK